MKIKFKNGYTVEINDSDCKNYNRNEIIKRASNAVKTLMKDSEYYKEDEFIEFLKSKGVDIALLTSSEYDEKYKKWSRANSKGWIGKILEDHYDEFKALAEDPNVTVNDFKMWYIDKMDEAGFNLKNEKFKQYLNFLNEYNTPLQAQKLLQGIIHSMYGEKVIGIKKDSKVNDVPIDDPVETFNPGHEVSFASMKTAHNEVKKGLRKNNEIFEPKLDKYLKDIDEQIEDAEYIKDHNSVKNLKIIIDRYRDVAAKAIEIGLEEKGNILNSKADKLEELFDLKQVVSKKDSKIKDDCSGMCENGVIYNYHNGIYTITHKNGEVEKFKEDKFKDVDELKEYYSKIKDAFRPGIEYTTGHKSSIDNLEKEAKAIKYKGENSRIFETYLNDFIEDMKFDLANHLESYPRKYDQNVLKNIIDVYIRAELAAEMAGFDKEAIFLEEGIDKLDQAWLNPDWARKFTRIPYKEKFKANKEVENKYNTEV